MNLPLLSRPTTRGACIEGPRPCPWVSCRHHLYLTVYGARVQAQSVEVDELEETCSLDVADAGAHSSREVAALMGMSHRSVLDAEMVALDKVRARGKGLE